MNQPSNDPRQLTPAQRRLTEDGLQYYSPEEAEKMRPIWEAEKKKQREARQARIKARRDRKPDGGSTGGGATR